MRCPDCNKFVGLEFQDPEVNSIEIDAEGAITCECRIVRCCADCSQELKEATLDMQDELPPDDVTAHTGEGHEFSIEEEGVDQVEEGGGRYAKSYFGATVNYKVTCTCGKYEHTGELTDKVPASGMDEMV